MSEFPAESDYVPQDGGPTSEDVESATRSCLAIFVIMGAIALFVLIFLLANWLF